MDDSTVIAALFRLLLPIAYQFNPQLVFVNANATSDGKKFQAILSPALIKLGS